MGEIRSLGYLTIATTDLYRWRALAHDVLDLSVDSGGDDTLHPRWEVRDKITLTASEPPSASTASRTASSLTTRRRPSRA